MTIQHKDKKMPAKKKILNKEMQKKDNSLTVDFYVKPHPNDTSIKILEIQSSVPEELIENLTEKTVSLSKKTGGCLFEIKDFADHNNHIGLFPSENELDKFITRVQKDVVQVLQEAGYDVNESSALLSTEPNKETKSISNLNEKKIYKFKIGDVVKHDIKKCISVSSGKIGIVKSVQTEQIGVDYGPGTTGHLLDGTITIPTGLWEWSPFVCLKLLHSADEDKANYLTFCAGCKNKKFYVNGLHTQHLVAPKTTMGKKNDN